MKISGPTTAVRMAALALLLLCVSTGVEWSFGGKAQAASLSVVKRYKAVVEKVIDGDSLLVKLKNEKRHLRLYGVDAPEWRQPYAGKAKKIMTDLLLHEMIDVAVLYTDKYGREIVLVRYKGNSVNQYLVEAGLAWVHIYYCKSEICELWRELEGRARKQQRGLWAQQHPVPPWVWKNR